MLAAITRRFQIDSPLVRAAPLGSGHIHSTFQVETADGARFILQRFNTEVFRNPGAVMANLRAVCAHLADKAGRSERESPQIVPARNGAGYVEGEGGELWRAFHFIPGTKSIDGLVSPVQAYELGRAFGRFLLDLTDLTTPPEETIPRFHDTPWRYEQLRAALAADSFGRARAVRDEVDFALARAGEASRVKKKMADGEIPTRIVHNDAKVSNLLFDAETGAGLCVIDLDTVMPGSALYDFGEMVRSGIGEGAEDEASSGTDISMPRFRAMVQGYLAGSGDLLTPAEREELAFAGRLMALENGVRFLTDYLEGDVYFRTSRAGQNLARARAQFGLVRAMEEAEGKMGAVVSG